MLSITDKEFNQIKEIMHKRTGVFLKPSKKPLVMTRLRKRMEELGLKTYEEYIALLRGANSQELESFINAITTNETYFFRHTAQFNYLFETILPEIVQQKSDAGKRGVFFWSAACSTGEEPYSLAITCNEYFKEHKNIVPQIMATDVNSDVINVARKGVYPARSFRNMPDALKEKYFDPVDSTGPIPRIDFAIKKSVKAKVKFKSHNLLNVFAGDPVDVVFLRNVMIYFQRDVRQKVVSLIESKVIKGGYLFISLSESLNDITTRFQMVSSGIYKKE